MKHRLVPPVILTLITFLQSVSIHFTHGRAVVLQGPVTVQAGVQTRRLRFWTDLFVPLPSYDGCKQSSCKRNGYQ